MKKLNRSTQLMELLRVGSQLGNVAFNLSQSTSMHADDVKILKSLHQQWDERFLAIQKELPTPTEDHLRGAAEMAEIIATCMELRDTAMTAPVLRTWASKWIKRQRRKLFRNPR